MLHLKLHSMDLETSSMQRGVRLALDVGSVRIGVAYCDPDGMMAVPLSTIAFSADAVDEIALLISEYSAIAVYVGKPVNLDGVNTKSTSLALEFAKDLANRVGDPSIAILMIDERLSTVSAQRDLHSAGRNTRNSKDIIDQVAAVIILEQALESEKRQGDLVGDLVESSHE